MRGTNTRYTEALLRLKGETQVTDDFESKLAENAGGYMESGFLQLALKSYDDSPPLLRAYSFTDSERIKTFSERVLETIGWLKKVWLEI